MQLHLEGSEDLTLSKERVFSLLTDPNFIAKSLPDAQESKVLDDGSIEARMKIGISFLTTNMHVKMRITDKVPSQHARMLVDGTGSGSNMKITSDFDLEGDTATKMKWAADAEITGVMAGIGSSILKGFSEKKVKEIFEGIKKAMEQAGS
jgi:carbon monoxide dehydrogenase subunit G